MALVVTKKVNKLKWISAGPPSKVVRNSEKVLEKTVSNYWN